MAPRGNVMGERYSLSDPGLDLSLSLSLGGTGTGTGRKRASAELAPVPVPVRGGGIGKQMKCGDKGGGGCNGWFKRMYHCNAELKELVPVGAGTRRDGAFCIAGSRTSSDTSIITTTKPTNPLQLKPHLSTHISHHTTKPNLQTINPNPNPNLTTNRVFPSMPHMPFVTVRAKGPNAPSVTGFLYRVTETADVFIVCSCHGEFFSPSGFVGHAGWRNVANPLRLIVVRPY